VTHTPHPELTVLIIDVEQFAQVLALVALAVAELGGWLGD
jgi:hypothetical protein